MNFDKFYFKEEVDSTPREGIKHLYTDDQRYSMKPEDFIDIVNFLEDNDGKLNDLNASISEKADGFSLKFGLDSDDYFYIESSNSGPVYDEGDFNDFTKSKKGETDPISEGYEDILKTLKNYDALQNYLKSINTYAGIKIVSECFYMPLAKTNEDDTLVKFIATWYKKKLMGSWATFVIIDIVDGKNRPVDDADTIKKELLNLSNSKIKFADNKVDVGEIDFNKEIETIKSFINKIEQEEGKRIQDIINDKNKDNTVEEKKKKIKNMILDFQKVFSNKLKSLVNNGKFGDYEGIVIKLANGIMFKVITDRFIKDKKEFNRGK